ncbi:MAG: hypothetical protein KKF48_04250 [Nanoarchaeota archaeon]|nr:hypothetical protein [Nanoarchaeota archaeon]MBU1028230.1 hypothetical protein [Nanoarchaeota archaeon]
MVLDTYDMFTQQQKVVYRLARGFNLINTSENLASIDDIDIKRYREGKVTAKEKRVMEEALTIAASCQRSLIPKLF